MSQSNLNLFPIEAVSLSPNTIPVFCWVFFVVEIIYKFFSSIQTQVGLCDEELEFEVLNENQDFESSCSGGKVEEDGHLRREDVEVVMNSLGIFCHPEGEKLQERLGFNDLSSLFEEKEPSLEEVKGAFDVFDKNGDGFIEARELQTVLCNLGFKDGLEMEKCRRMISSFDDNGDGMIDFNEFVKFMENSFC
ncbi:unnamed protein product [Camellia sinensis]|uniref:Calmodulin-like protein 45 n=2 Tax=cellular organisms TaxID=131567 RepID=A0A2P0QD45_CAMSI|nr:calmodulin-like protein 45 [Camellia sinensis]